MLVGGEGLDRRAGVAGRFPGEFYGMARPSFRRRRLAGDSEGGRAMQFSVLGIDLGKNVCSIVGLDASGAVDI